MQESRVPAQRPAVVKIDGDKVRRFREEKGLTQLYVATAVGVTTDTISRWENRRYPTIKRENAEKLAAALEMDLEEILDRGDTRETRAPGSQGAPPAGPDLPSGDDLEPGSTGQPGKGRALPRRASIIGTAALLLLLLAAAGWYLYYGSPVRFQSNRFLPAHSAPGQPFPVVITVECEGPGPVSLILREQLPRECTPVRAFPPYSTWDPERHTLKWLHHAGGGKASFLYMARASRDTSMGSELHFKGIVTVRKGRSDTQPVAGSDTLEVLPLHWADSNGDGRIDDEEILSAYEEFGRFEGSGFELKEVEAIWAAEGYEWNKETRAFRILEQAHPGGER